MAAAIQAGTSRFKEAFIKQQMRIRQNLMEKERQIEVRFPNLKLCLLPTHSDAISRQVLNADPYDIEVILSDCDLEDHTITLVLGTKED